MDDQYRQSVECSIVSLLSFFDIFEHPLTIEEIKKYMYKYDIPDYELRSIISESQVIEQKDQFYFLPGQKEHVYARRKKQEHLQKLWKRVYKYIPFLRNIPYVRMVAVCNTLAFQSCTTDSDIDLFIIVEKKHLWLSRLLITSYLHLMGVRRHGKKSASRFCLSFYTTTDNLNLAPIAKDPYDIYLAYWLWTMIPVVGEAYYDQLLEANDAFLEQYFGNKSIKNKAWCLPDSSKAKHIQSVQEKLLNNKLGKKVEQLVGNWQRNRAVNKLQNLGPDSSNIVSDQMLKSHNHDKRDYFREEYEKRLRSVGMM